MRIEHGKHPCAAATSELLNSIFTSSIKSCTHRVMLNWIVCVCLCRQPDNRRSVTDMYIWVKTRAHTMQTFWNQINNCESSREKNEKIINGWITTRKRKSKYWITRKSAPHWTKHQARLDEFLIAMWKWKIKTNWSGCDFLIARLIGDVDLLLKFKLNLFVRFDLDRLRLAPELNNLKNKLFRSEK